MRALEEVAVYDTELYYRVLRELVVTFCEEQLYVVVCGNRKAHGQAYMNQAFW